ncbi:MAG TPA: hypothetical protein VM683_14215 [Anaeromyxobacteraceae bacterium]|jgi:hypothetical protein|nr:hypothetical protein [Anaeromyxobacteraceae bacterium]
MIRRAGFALAVAGLMGGFAATSAVAGDNEKEQGRNSSPYVVGVWKLILDKNPKKPPRVDTEVRFINPTQLTVTLEYAFFELDGTFCGCDRDTFQPNKTTIYTMNDETTTQSPIGKTVFTCQGTSGALKSIVFLNNGQEIFLDETSQVGFTTHVFGDVDEDLTTHFLTGKVMTESGMVPVPINDETRKEIQQIHDQCNMVNGPL